MNPNFTRDEIEVIFEVYNAIANDPNQLMKQEEAAVMSGILKRTRPKEKPLKDRYGNKTIERTFPKCADDFKSDHLVSIKFVCEQTLNSLSKEQKVEYPAFSTILEKVKKFVK